ncbi:hypothetical protein S245_025261 [Arachis hypogaea]
MKAIEFNSKHVNNMNVYQFDRSRINFTVEELAAVPGSRQQNYQVLLDECKCDYGYFQALHIPCRDVLAAFSHARLDWKRFVHPVYRMESVFNVYRSEFQSIGIRNNMDDVEHNGEKRCGLCRQSWHTWRTCTALGDGGASSS